MIIALLSCRMVVDFPSDKGSADPDPSPPTTPTPTTPTPTTPPITPAEDPASTSIRGLSAGDNIGAGGLASGKTADDRDLLWIASPALGEVALFPFDALEGAVSYSAATTTIATNGLSSVAAEGQTLAISTSSAVWWIDGPLPAGRVGVDTIASSALQASSDGDEGEGAPAIDVGDYDGDGEIDLALGNTEDRGGDGLASVFLASDSLDEGELSPDDADVQIRGVGSGLGRAIALGSRDGSPSLLVACSSASCYIVAGDTDSDDQDVNEIASTTLQGVGQVAIHVADIDGDGEDDVTAIDNAGDTFAWLSPLPSGLHDPTSADLRASGAPAEAVSASEGRLLVGSPVSASGALFVLPSSGERSLPEDAEAIWQGVAPGDRFGAALSAQDRSGRFAVAAPLAAGDAAQSGVVYLLSLP